MSAIKEVSCREVFGPLGMSTIETAVLLEDGSRGVSSVAAHDPEGKYAAVNLVEREQNNARGQGTLKAVEKIQNIIAPKIVKMDAQGLQDVDAALFELDGTPDKSRFGANALLSVSMAVARAGAKSSRQPLFKYLRQFIKRDGLSPKVPSVILSMLSGGVMTRNMLDFKDFLVIPASFKSFQESMLIGYNLQEKLMKDLQHRQVPPLLSVDGGYALSLPDNESAFTLLSQVIEASNVRLGFDVFLGFDARADDFYHEEKYHLKDTSMPLSSEDLISIYSDFIEKHQILYIADPLNQDDWEGWEKFGKKIKSDRMIAGERLTATNLSRLQMAINKKAISSIVVKPIQAGTITEALVVAEIARLSGIKIVVPRQNGGIVDDFMADFAVAIGADYVNFGPLTRGDFVVNYNRLSEIEGEIRDMK